MGSCISINSIGNERSLIENRFKVARNQVKSGFEAEAAGISPVQLEGKKKKVELVHEKAFQLEINCNPEEVGAEKSKEHSLARRCGLTTEASSKSVIRKVENVMVKEKQKDTPSTNREKKDRVSSDEATDLKLVFIVQSSGIHYKVPKLEKIEVSSIISRRRDTSSKHLKIQNSN